MAQQVSGGVAEDLRIEGRDDVSEAQSTFDRLLRAYFARLLVREVAANGINHSFELPFSQGGHSRST
ncbi:hypothetical protein GGD63_005276 [Bradyrhizobium sp. cir1]|uniref:hypothetical protein n=1 Tax=Bradyrhizobium sp. cir1 TaxID=1445730 RepID=UPI0016061D97|nr:hypothetical protein [Bradyrhizobium sp. cir1]MBB4372468.1 hypothetical protein [Bradyrhizobium sp. cir1]